MEYIDKSNHVDYYPIYMGFEESAWNGDPNEQRYYGYDYDHLPKELKSLLRGTQGNFCCYCMAIINKYNTTIEHVFPQKPSPTDSLLCYGISCIQRTSGFNNTRTIPNVELTNLPHDISYYNLIASCDSKVSCNNRRGNDKIRPFFFNPMIKTIFKYDEEGNIEGAPYQSEIETLGLAHNTLIKYRKLWKFIKNKRPLPDLFTPDIIIKYALEIALTDEFFIDFHLNKAKLKTSMRYVYFIDN